MTVITGAEHISYLRSATIAGKEWNKGRDIVTAYAKCCGVWIYFNGPGNLCETNSIGLSDWQRVEGANGAQVRPILASYYLR